MENSHQNLTLNMGWMRHDASKNSPNSSGTMSKYYKFSVGLGTSPRLHWLLPEVARTDEEFMVPAPTNPQLLDPCEDIPTAL